jgi:hypothetical protein
MTAAAPADVSIQYAAPIASPFFGEQKRHEWPQEQYVVRLADYRPENLILVPSFISPRWSAEPSSYSLGDMLDWSFSAGPDPERPSGTISVTLEYIGRLSPPSADEFWD